MKQSRLASLKIWLHDVLEIPTELFSVSIESGKCKAFFDDIDEDTGVDPDFVMNDQHQITVIVRNYAGDAVKLKIGLLNWLYEQNQMAELNYDCEQNNQNTFDWFFDLNIEEKSRSKASDVVTC